MKNSEIDIKKYKHIRLYPCKEKPKEYEYAIFNKKKLELIGFIRWEDKKQEYLFCAIPEALCIKESVPEVVDLLEQFNKKFSFN